MADGNITIKDWFLGSAKTPWIEFFRSLFVGAAAFVADFAVLTVLKEVFFAKTLVASTLGFVFGVIVNYLLSVYWAFRASNVSDATKRFLIFTAIAVMGLAINNEIIRLFDEPFAEQVIFGTWLPTKYYYMAGKIVATVVVFFWNFFSRKLLLFRGESAPPEGTDSQ